MNVVLINTNSFGGNYEYSLRLADAYRRHPEVSGCVIVVPVNAPLPNGEGVYNKLISDKPGYALSWLCKLHFLYRSIVNPLRLFFYLRRLSPSFVVFNDYEQLSAWIWVPFFMRLKKKHTFGVILHDPDRDHYFRYRWMSCSSMKQVMRVMHLALYHEVLPDKPYYRKDIPYVQVPHGIYDPEEKDLSCYEELIKRKNGRKMLGIIGHIRDEKNYHAVLDVLPSVPDTLLLVAGAPASSGVPLASYHTHIAEKGLSERVIWMEKYLSAGELQSVIQACDLILLYYKESFTSQSGIMNMIAPHRKKILISDVPSALARTAERFGLGYRIPLNPVALREGIQKALSDPDDAGRQGWDKYLTEASWEQHVSRVLTIVQTL